MRGEQCGDGTTPGAPIPDCFWFCFNDGGPGIGGSPASGPAPGGRLTSVGTASSNTNIATYIYDAFSQRVRTVANSQTSDFIFDPAGRALDQISGTTWQRGEIFIGGMHLGTYNNLVNPATTYFEHADWAGTVRARSSVTGASVETCTSLPFGDNQNCVGSDGSPLHFATLASDPESNLQHAWFRQYSTTSGRWTAQDPSGLAAVDLANPQSWNRYAYVRNNALALTDPLGLAQAAPPDPGAPIPDCWWFCFNDGGPGLGGGPASGPGPGGLGGGGPLDNCTNYVLANCGAPAKNDPCANSTLAAAGVTAQQQITTAQIYMATGWASGSSPYGIPLTNAVGSMIGFYFAVRTGGPNDIKNQPGHSGKNPIDVNAGNISFGITCPYGASFCQFAAGLAQTLGGHPDFNGTLATGFDTPSDNAGIQVGQAMRAAGCHE
jgi:RHS repeat-associated protein